jgi:hypothetical protein
MHLWSPCIMGQAWAASGITLASASCGASWTAALTSMAYRDLRRKGCPACYRRVEFLCVLLSKTIGLFDAVIVLEPHRVSLAPATSQTHHSQGLYWGPSWTVPLRRLINRSVSGNLMCVLAFISLD